MKKLMIAAAIVCAAAFAQAASFSWDASKLAYDEAGTKYTAAPTDGSFVLVLLNNGDTADWAAADAANIVSTATASYSKASGPKPESFKVTGTVGDNLAVKNWYGVMFQDKEGALHRLIDYSSKDLIDTSVQIASWDGTDIGAITLSSGSDTYTFTSVAYQVQPNATPTPEPTSGLLLLLGVAGIALRRKQK